MSTLPMRRQLLLLLLRTQLWKVATQPSRLTSISTQGWQVRTQLRLTAAQDETRRQGEDFAEQIAEQQPSQLAV